MAIAKRRLRVLRQRADELAAEIEVMEGWWRVQPTSSSTGDGDWREDGYPSR